VRIPRAPHAWNLSPAAAIRVQRRLAGRVHTRSPHRREVRIIAGVDCALSADGSRCLAAAVAWCAETRSLVEERVVSRPLRFPYVPGLLSFREAPAVLAALRALDCDPDLLMVDGHGIAHPRRFGIASHLGVLCGVPAIGIAKSRLCGEHAEPGAEVGARAALVDAGARIGTALRTREGVRPVYVSIGHAIGLAAAERRVLAACAGFRLPEPTRLADRAVARAKREGLATAGAPSRA
jgi:deoxyribonuclease V